LFFLPWRMVPPLSPWPGAVLREGHVKRVCFLVLHNFMGDRRHVFVKLRVRVFLPYLCCTTYGFPQIGQSSTQDPTAFISTLLSNCWFLFWASDWSSSFFDFLCSCPCLVVSF
jgi:hypothetical protein